MGDDFRSRASRRAFARALAGVGPGRVGLSVGGGPSRPHPALVNLNRYPGPGVDLVGDAHALPLGEGRVAAVYCEAVLEHLEDPGLAVREMHRVLAPGGLVFSVVPFLQAFHPSPDHFQNYTLHGHRRVYEAAGFTVLEAGTCVGPVGMLADLLTLWIEVVLPRGLRGLVRLLARPLLALARPLDRLAHVAPAAHVLAATTYVLARRPER